MAPPVPQQAAQSPATTIVASWPFEQRLQVALDNAPVGPEVVAQLRSVVSPESLEIMAGVLTTWLLSHAFGVGEVIDAMIAAVGVIALGFSVFVGLDHLYEFAKDEYGARREEDLIDAGGHFAKAVAILGVQAVLAFLFKNRPAAGREKVPPPPPAGTPRVVTWTSTEPKGEGWTDNWGNITVSRLGDPKSRKEALFHEAVHRWFVPRFNLLRNFRVECLPGSYVNSSLWRYFEEFLAEGIAKGRVEGWAEFFRAFAFPVQAGYLYLMRAGSSQLAAVRGKGFIPELGGLLVTGPIIGTVPVQLWLGAAPPVQPSP